MEIPREIKSIIDKLKKRGFEAFVVGGCVRDLLRGADPKDWDIATDAKPEEIQKVFPKSFYENKFLTVTIRTASKDPAVKEVQVTTYRSESKYTDKRHPDEVRFAKTIEDDLSRRDFTINALAIDLKSQIPIPKSQSNLKSQTKKDKNWSLDIGHWGFGIIDLFEGQKDLKAKVIRTVGSPEERFAEDALRMMRAIRFATSLDFTIEERTAQAIKKNAALLKVISKERIRDELIKIIMSANAAQGIEMLRVLGLLKYIAPELEEGYQVGQNKHHIYECYEHALFSLKYAAQKDFNLYVRSAALLHDIGKPRSKRGEGENATFYNHEMIGAKMTEQLLTRLRFAKKDVDKITKLVRFHLFYYNVDEVTESSVRRLVRQVGPENIEELLQVRMCDRIGSGVPKAEPYKLRHLKYIIDKVAQDPISVKMLNATGNEIMSQLGIPPGPRIGQILDILLGYVLEDPKKNKKAWLLKEIGHLGKLSEKELDILAKKAQKEREKVVIKQDEMTKQKYWVS